MADNYTFLDASAASQTAAADEIASVKYPRVKIAQGADGSATDVSAAAPLQVSLENHAANAVAVKVDGSAATQPVSVASLPLPSGAATAANQTTGNSSLATLAGAVAGTEVQVDVVSVPTTTVQATNLDIRDLSQAQDAVAVYGSDDGGTTKRIIKTDLNGAVQVDVESIAAGNNNIGDVDVASIAAGDNNIGNVDIVSIAAGDNNIGNMDVASLPAGNLGQQAMAASLSTVPANNITDATYIGDIKFGESLPAGTAAIGKLAANSGVDIGDVDITSVVPGTGATNLGKAEDAAHSSGDTGVMALAVRDDDPVAATSGAAGDYEPLHTDARGVLWVRNVPDTTDLANGSGEWVSKPFAYTGAQTDAIIWSPAAGKRWYITDIQFIVSAAATVTFEDDRTGGDTNMGLGGSFAANSGLVHSFKTPLFSGEDAADLILTTSAGNIEGVITGYEI